MFTYLLTYIVHCCYNRTLLVVFQILVAESKRAKKSLACIHRPVFQTWSFGEDAELPSNLKVVTLSIQYSRFGRKVSQQTLFL